MGKIHRQGKRRWRKVDVGDVEKILEEEERKRRTQTLNLSTQKDSELFSIDDDIVDDIIINNLDVDKLNSSNIEKIQQSERDTNQQTTDQKNKKRKERKVNQKNEERRRKKESEKRKKEKEERLKRPFYVERYKFMNQLIEPIRKEVPASSAPSFSESKVANLAKSIRKKERELRREKNQKRFKLLQKREERKQEKLKRKQEKLKGKIQDKKNQNENEKQTQSEMQLDNSTQIVEKEKEKEKEKPQMLQMIEVKKHKETPMEKAKNRQVIRTKLDFDLYDLWSSAPSKKNNQKVNKIAQTQIGSKPSISSPPTTDLDWLSVSLYPQPANLNEKEKKKPHRKFKASETELKALEVDSTQSYNPEPTLLETALAERAARQIRKEQKTQKLQKKIFGPFPKLKPKSKNQKRIKLSETNEEESKEIQKEKKEENKEIQEAEKTKKKKEKKAEKEEESVFGHIPTRPKSTKERKKEKELKIRQIKESKVRWLIAKFNQLNRLPQTIHKVKVELKKKKVRRKMQLLRKILLKSKTKKVGSQIFIEDEQPILTPQQIPSSLRLLKPAPVLLRERFQSFQKRNIIEVTGANSPVLPTARVRFSVKPSHRD